MQKGVTMILFALGLTVVLHVQAAEINFDPGLKICNAAFYLPNHKYYFENCPTAGGRCYGNLPKGSGFYTLSYDCESSLYPCCTPNTEAIINDPDFPASTGQRCPFRFFWNVVEPYARIEADMLTWSNAVRIYTGLQENMNTPYDGMPPSYQLPAWNLRFVEFELRSKACYPAIPDHYAHGLVSHYISLYDATTDKTVSFRLNILAHLTKPVNADPPEYWTRKTWNQAWVPGNPDPTNSDVWELQGEMWGLTDNWNPWYDPTGSACSSDLSLSPWRKYRIDVHAIYNGIVAEGYMTRDYFDRATWVGGIVAGIESWGSSYAAVDVRNYRVLDS